MQINKGEYVAIMGASGSGKSTLMNIIGCLDSPSKGTYVLNNMQVNTLNDNKLAEIRNKEIGFVFQTFSLLPRFNVLENLMLPLVYAGYEKKRMSTRANEVIKSVGLEERMNHIPNELSGR